MVSKLPAIAGCVLLAAPALASSAESPPLVFEKDVRPILKAHCFHCHGEEAEDVRADLDVRLVKGLHVPVHGRDHLLVVHGLLPQ